ncbi:hypothetical protein GHT09_003222 [Marmota monax]|uniref:Uncharacterized protein n=1 Tax=Marmota monax TaxID=9995 RepID=A0A834V7T8_MARMO|nr:hypothetical protein GHT09_003222 [Marmota monax]
MERENTWRQRVCWAPITKASPVTWSSLLREHHQPGRKGGLCFPAGPRHLHECAPHTMCFWPCQLNTKAKEEAQGAPLRPQNTLFLFLTRGTWFKVQLLG